MLLVELRGASTLNADVNYDGVVNAPDFSILNARPEGAMSGDADSDPTNEVISRDQRSRLRRFLELRGQRQDSGIQNG